MATFTLYLPDQVLARVDAARGSGPGRITRSGAIRVFIEEGLERQGLPRPPVVERSPEPAVDSGVPREFVEHVEASVAGAVDLPKASDVPEGTRVAVTGPAVVRTSRPTDERVSAITGHKAGCRCLGCERVRGNVT